MARAENQGLQIALIIFVMLTIVLGVMTFFFFRNYQEAVAAKDTATKESNESRRLATSTQDEINKIKDHLGVDRSMPYGDLEKAFNDDMKAYANALPPDKQHYRQALESLATAYNEMSAQLVDNQNKYKQVQADLERHEKAKQPQIEKAQQESQASLDDLNKQREEFDSDRRKITEEKDTLLANVSQKDTELNSTKEKAAKDAQVAKASIASLETINRTHGDTIKKFRSPAFEVANGEVRLVNAENQTVYIGLGSADRLRRLTTFSVHDRNANTREGKGQKGSIEVIQIVDDHLALARVLDEDLSNPIAQGDKIYTPLWKTGQPQRFAILGNIDIDGDGADDREMVKNIITSIDGVIDAEMDPQGKISGNMTLDTRFLIKGTLTVDRAMIDGATKMQKDAEVLGIEIIPAPKFFELAGWKDPQQTLRYGPGSNAEAIRPDVPDKERPRSAKPAEANYQKRRPYVPKPATAYTEEEKK